LEFLRAKEGALREKLVARLVHQLLVALEYCHASGIAHRDVKPENMLLTDSSACPDCKVIDFGFATPYKRAAREMAGTAPYLAPEVAIQGQGYSPKADIWSVGVTAFELLAGAAPFGREQDYGGNVAALLQRVSGYRSFDEDLLSTFDSAPGCTRRKRSNECRDFLRWVLDADPSARPTAAEAAEHPWLLRHRAKATGLTSEMLQSMKCYAEAPSLARSCLFAIVAKGADDLDVEGFGSAFLESDGDGDGKVSREDLEGAVHQARGWWGPRVDVGKVFEAAHVDQSGFLGYTEFVAACLYSRYGTLDASLVDRAFEALDHDRDGLLFAEDAKPLFGAWPEGLPLDRPFSLGEWRSGLLGEKGVRRGDPTCGLGFLDRLLGTSCGGKPSTRVAEDLTFEPQAESRPAVLPPDPDSSASWPAPCPAPPAARRAEAARAKEEATPPPHMQEERGAQRCTQPGVAPPATATAAGTGTGAEEKESPQRAAAIAAMAAAMAATATLQLPAPTAAVGYGHGPPQQMPWQFAPRV
jgi:hypothetical protein